MQVSISVQVWLGRLMVSRRMSALEVGGNKKSDNTQFLNLVCEHAPHAMNAYCSCTEQAPKMLRRPPPGEASGTKEALPIFLYRGPLSHCSLLARAQKRRANHEESFGYKGRNVVPCNLQFSCFFFSARKQLRSEKVARLSYVSSYRCAQRFLADGWTMYGSTKPAF